jgi:hypothetical protein
VLQRLAAGFETGGNMLAAIASHETFIALLRMAIASTMRSVPVVAHRLQPMKENNLRSK